MKRIYLRGKYADKFALVDDDDYEVLSKFKWQGHTNKAGATYASSLYGRHWKRSRLLMHRVITDCPKGKDVDHKNHDTLDNRKANLRVCTRSQNIANRQKGSGRSQFKGVHWSRKENRWVASIKVLQKLIYLGQFKSELEAAKIYDTAARKHFGEFACTNQCETHGVEGCKC